MRWGFPRRRNDGERAGDVGETQQPIPLLRVGRQVGKQAAGNNNNKMRFFLVADGWRRLFVAFCCQKELEKTTPTTGREAELGSHIGHKMCGGNHSPTLVLALPCRAWPGLQ